MMKQCARFASSASVVRGSTPCERRIHAIRLDAMRAATLELEPTRAGSMLARQAQGRRNFAQTTDWRAARADR
jgi:hypothetical protein